MARWIVLVALLLGWLMPGSARAADLEAGSVTILPPVNLSEFPTLQALEEARLPAADRYEIARRLRGLTIIPSVRTRPEPRLQGERQSFQVVNTAENRVFAAEAELLAIGEHIYVWVEPGYGVTQAAAQRFADGFDTQVYEQVRALWGSEPSPGIDGDPRIYALFVAGINPGVAAYYTSQHAYPAAVVGESNEHEMIFFNLAALGPKIDRPELLSTAAHEFQHMIRHHIEVDAQTWLDEGFSMFTERHLGFESNLWAALAFANAPGVQLNRWQTGGQRAAQYGASMLFVAYLHERLGLDALRALGASPRQGLDAVDEMLRANGLPGIELFMADWALVSAIQDASLGYGYASPAWRDVPALRPLLSEEALPLSFERRGSQYSSEVYSVNDVSGVGQVRITLDANDFVPMLPLFPASGQWFLYSNAGDEVNTRLTRAFDLRGVTTAALEYKVWYDLESYWDYAYVSISADGGITWDLLEGAHTTSENPNARSYGAGYTGNSVDWKNERIVLDAYAGQEILLRFEMVTDDAVSHPGMALDDIRIEAIGYFSDFEADADSWQMEGWLRADNKLPQRAWVQAIQQRSDGVAVTRWLIEPDGGARNEWLLDLYPDTQQLTVVITPFAPVTTLPMRYTLRIEAGA